MWLCLLGVFMSVYILSSKIKVKRLPSCGGAWYCPLPRPAFLQGRMLPWGGPGQGWVRSGRRGEGSQVVEFTGACLPVLGKEASADSGSDFQCLQKAVLIYTRRMAIWEEEKTGQAVRRWQEERMCMN